MRTHAADQICHHRSVATRRHIVRIHEAVGVGIPTKRYPRDYIVGESVLKSIKAVVDYCDFDVMLHLVWNTGYVFGKSIYVFQPYLSNKGNTLVLATECDVGYKLLLFCGFIALEF